MKGLRLFRRTRGSWTSLHPPPDDVDERSGARHGMGPRARRSSPRATQTRGPTRLDRRHEPARAQPTRTGHVAKQVLLVIGVAQVITRALSRLDEMALREGSDIRAFRQLARLSFLRAKSMEHMQIWPGEPYPLGANFDGTGTNFSLFSELA